MALSLSPYMFFTGNAREAMEFYKGIFGGELYLQTYEDAMGEKAPAEQKNQIMHADLKGDFRIFGSDTEKASAKMAKVSLCLGGDTEMAKMEEIFAKLGDGGKIFQPLKKESWGDTFGALTDKFGVEWMMNIPAKKE